MSLRGLFKDSSFVIQLVLTIGLMIFGMVFGVLVFQLLSLARGIPMDTTLADAGSMRLMQFWVSLFSFFVAAYLLALLFSDDEQEYLQLRKPPVMTILLTIVLVISSLPFLNLVVHLNEQIVFPESMKSVESYLRMMEDNAQNATKMLLTTDSVSAFLFNILLFAVVAGVGEEFFFRGVMQRVVGKLTANPHVVIWLVAFIFSAIHFQFYGFIPRMLLGALMGYLLLWTRSIWVPVAAHFTNNIIGVIGYYCLPDQDSQQQFDTLGFNDTLWAAFVSLAVAVVLLITIRKTRVQAVEV